MSIRSLGLALIVIAALVFALEVSATAGAIGHGPSVLLAPVAKHSGCHIRGSLPDHACTPGARFGTASRMMVCTPGYSERARNVSYSEKSADYAEYGTHRHFDGENGEVDHVVALELGGSNDEANLWPESAVGPYGSHQKDALENELHSEVCRRALTLARAQQLIAGDWVRAYRARFK